VNCSILVGLSHLKVHVATPLSHDGCFTVLTTGTCLHHESDSAHSRRRTATSEPGGTSETAVADALRVSLGETDSRGGARTGARPEPTCWCALLFPIEHKKNVAYNIDFDFFNPEESVLLGLARGMQVTLEPGDVLFLAACRRKSQ
jgi:hypothetical protein